MVDFVELEVVGTPISTFLSNDLLDFERSVSEKTGLLDNKAEADYLGVLITIYDSGRTVIKVSLHKFKNGGIHNTDQFTFCDLGSAIIQLATDLNIDPNKCVIHQIEFGVNILPPILISLLLDGLMYHNGVCFSDSKPGLYYEFKHQRYVVKIYDKRRLSHPYFKALDETLRIEIKIRKMAHIEGYGVKKLSDLLSDHWIDPIGELLADTWNKILFFDPTLKDCDSNIDKWSNPVYWKNIPRQTRYVQRRKYEAALKKNSHNMQSIIGEAIRNQWRMLQINR